MLHLCSLSGDCMRKIRKDITGQRFNHLTALAPILHGTGNVKWECMCDCGTLTIVRDSHLKSGDIKSCGCGLVAYQHSNTRPIKHGKSRTATYRTWHGMRQRCNNPNRGNFKNYGGRGITVCDRWDKFENFLADMGERPDGKSIDRIDCNGNYETSNCRWATDHEQRINRRKK